MKRITQNPAALKALEFLGQNIRLARRKRGFSVRNFAERMGVTEKTVQRLEQGHEGVSIGTLAMAFLVIGELRRLEELLDVAKDDFGLLSDQERLPQRIRKPKTKALEGKAKPIASSSDPNDEGMGW